MLTPVFRREKVIQSQEIITADKATLKLTAVAVYGIADARGKGRSTLDRLYSQIRGERVAQR